MDEQASRLYEAAEKLARENAVAVERAASDARAARDAVAEFRPLVLARSGDEQRRDKYETNVNQAHDKLRDHDTRLRKVEKWLERFVWIGIGLVVAGQAIWWVVERILNAGAKH